MLLKNISKRLLTINGPDGQSIQIKPGNNPPVEVPQSCVSNFVKLLIADKYCEEIQTKKQSTKEEKISDKK